MLLLRVLAAFWAADIMDEKNPDAALKPGVVGLPSNVGVLGAGMILDNLLGPREPEPALARLCITDVLCGEPVVLPPSGERRRSAERRSPV